MKKTIRELAIYATLGLMAPFAQVTQLQAQTPTPSPAPSPTAAAAQTTCTDEVKSPLYADFTKYRTTDAPKAYDAAKKWLAACPTEDGAIPIYLKKWVAAYDKENRKIRLTNLFVDQRKYAEASTLAKEILADEPDNVAALITLGYGGYVLAVTTKNEAGNAEAANYAKKAIQVIESGKAPEPPASWNPFKSKDDALGYLHYSVAYLERTSNPTEALTYFIKAAQFDSEIKKNPQIYVFIAGAYEAQYAKMSADYEATYKGKDETPESKLAIANINQVVDRIIDALARAVAVAGTDAAGQQSKAVWLTRLTELYKFRKGSDAGLNEMIASVLSKPLPPVPTPLTTLPAAPATTTTTPATGSASNTGSAVAPGAAVPTPSNSTVAPAASASPTTTPKTTAAPAATATSKKAPVKPKTRNNHRRH